VDKVFPSVEQREKSLSSPPLPGLIGGEKENRNLLPGRKI
jgi:hypothetical protein